MQLFSAVPPPSDEDIIKELDLPEGFEIDEDVQFSKFDDGLIQVSQVGEVMKALGNNLT